MDIIASNSVVKSLSLENIRNLEGFARTTVSDYYIKSSSFNFKNTIFKNNKVSIYEADWKYSRVCVKKILLKAETIIDHEPKKNQKKNRRHSIQNILKSQKDEHETEDLNNEIYNELLLLSKCIHPKIVQFFGFSKDTDSLCLIFEYMENGNLQDYLKSYSLTLVEKLNILIDVSVALHYLHTRYPNKIMHRDIKPSNILLNKYKQAKLSDFGISKVLQLNKNDKSHDNSSEKGTYIWMAPEVLIGNAYNQTADIYSLGLVMYFLLSENLPFYQYNLNMVQLMLKKSKYEVELNLDEIKNAQLKYLIGMCVTRMMTERPTAEYIIKVLYDILDDIEKN